MRLQGPLTAALVAGGCHAIFDLEHVSSGDAGSPIGEPRADANIADFRAPYGCDEYTIALYHFDGPQLEDACAPALDLVNAGAARIDSDTGLLDFGAAREFTDSDYASTTGTNVVDLTNQFTVELWVNAFAFGTPTGYATLVAVNDGAPGGRQFYLALDQTGHVRVTKGAIDCTTITPDLGVSSSATLTWGTWHHVRASWDGSRYHVAMARGSVVAASVES